MKKKIRQTKPVPKSRKSFDAKLAALAPNEQLHQLFFNGQNNDGFFEIHLRELATWRRLHEVREQPKMKEPVGLMIDGQVVDTRSQAERNKEFLDQELSTLTMFCRAALQLWKPEIFEQIAATMRKISVEDKKAEHFNPFKPACGMDYKNFLRAVILLESKKGIVNQWQLACALENTNPNQHKQSDSEFRRTVSTRKNIGNICKRLKVLSKIGRPPKVES